LHSILLSMLAVLIEPGCTFYVSYTPQCLLVLFRLLASDFEHEGRVPLMVHAGSLGGRRSYSLITEFTFKNASHITKIALSLFKREQKHLCKVKLLAPELFF